jgi:hypothetical protein
MKSSLYFQIIFLAFTLNACIGPNYYTKRGNYDAAISFALVKIQKHPRKADKHILALEQAWKIEQTKITERIEFFKLDGSPKSWVQIYGLYLEIDAHQSSIAPHLPLYISKEFRYADIEIVGVKSALIDAKLKAANFMFAKGEDLLAKNTKLSARDAFLHFQKVKEYYGTFRDVDAKIDQAYNLGQHHILVSYSNHSQMIIPQEFMNNLNRIDANALNTTWTKYHLNSNDFITYDYFIEVFVSNVDIGPEQVNNNSYVDKKQIQNGFQYVLDPNGNVAKDSSGNDVKELAHKNITATVYRTEQIKVGILAGVVNYVRSDGTVFQSFPFQENLVFKNLFVTFQGDAQALSAESQGMIGGQGLPFPMNLQMVMDASEIIKNRTFGLMQGNQNLVLR